MVLRALLNGTELEETVKWGAPAYTINGKNVIGLASFKNWCCLWFHQGVLLKDEAKVLYNAQEGKTKALRQWRFLKGADMDFGLIGSYVQEAIDNQKAGKVIKQQRKAPKALLIPIELKEAFEANPILESAFELLTPGLKREFATYIGSAKQEKTRKSRLAKSEPLILAGHGLYRKYKQ